MYILPNKWNSVWPVISSFSIELQFIYLECAVFQPVRVFFCCSCRFSRIPQQWCSNSWTPLGNSHWGPTNMRQNVSKAHTTVAHNFKPIVCSPCQRILKKNATPGTWSRCLFTLVPYRIGRNVGFFISSMYALIVVGN